MNWLKVFRIILITDSVVSLLKLALTFCLIVDGVQWKQKFDKTEKYDSSYLTEFAIVLHFMGTIFLLTLILLRLVTNYYQYRNEPGNHKITTVGKCSKVCCCGCCSFTVHIFSIVLFIISTWIWISNSVEWINGIVAISFLCWDVVIFCIMIIFKSLMSKITYPNVVKYEKHNSTEEINA